MNGPCTWPVHSLYTAVDGRIHRPQTRACTRYTAAYTGRKHGRVQSTRPCTRLCSCHGRTVHGRVHGTYTAVHTGHKHGRVDGRVHGTRRRPCTRYTAPARPCIRYVHGRVRAAYPAGYGPRTRPCFAAYRLRTRPCSGHGRTMCMARVRPYTQFVHGRGRPCTVCTRSPTVVYRLYTAVHGPCTWSVRDRVYGRVYGPCAWRRTYRVYGRVHDSLRRVRPCTPACKGGVHGASTAVYRVHLHGRVPCTRPCLRRVYTAAHILCTRPCTGHVHSPSVTRSRRCTRPVHGRVR